ncbi:MAG TPA: orotidine-5'-phosphate decarboxylase [Terriglobales bacterium]|nr:orotidine-5'-phosphate decarboxylase [Terriglobales bacterium]
MSPLNDRLIVALDVSTAVEAQEIVYELGDSVSFYKVGLQLFTAEGPKIVTELVNSGRKVFLDLKLHDIPNTVAGAVKVASELGAQMLTVHAAGGTKMLQSAVHAASSATQPPLILAVTVLTSFSQPDLEESGVKARLSDQVLYLGRLAKSAGCGGVVASPQEARNLRSALGSAMAVVTPGIRPAGSQSGDQSRIATPSAAIRAGASHLVVGRPILGAANRRHAAEAIVEEINGALPAAEMEIAGSRPA